MKTQDYGYTLPKDGRVSQVIADLEKACTQGDLDLVQAIFSKLPKDPGLEAIIVPQLGICIMEAARVGQAEIVTFLLDRGCNMGQAIVYAAHQDCSVEAAIRVFDALLDHKADLVEFPEELYRPLYTGDTDLLKYLLTKGANPNGLDEFEYHPLYQSQNEAQISLLLEFGADPKQGSLFHKAISFRSIEDCLQRCEFLLKKGIDINLPAMYPGIGEPGTRRYKRGMRFTGNEGTALHWAVRGFYTSMYEEVDKLPRVRWLLDHGADPEIKDNVGKRAVDYTDDPVLIALLNGFRTGI